MWGLILIPVRIDFDFDGIDFDSKNLILALVQIDSGVGTIDSTVNTK